jgi:hypothetical protein
MAADPGHEAVRVEGLAAFIRAMRQAEADLDDLKDATQRAGEIVLAAATSRAPRRTGALAGSGRASRAARRAIVRFGSARVPYAGPIHWGWPRRHIGAQPFALDAARATEPTWLAGFTRDIERLVTQVEGST